MTVSELIALLQTRPGDLRVVVNGYEQGYDDLSPGQLSIVRAEHGRQGLRRTTRIRLGTCRPRKRSVHHR